MSDYFKTCQYCGAHLDPGERCTCREENRHRNMFQRKRENYEITERLGGLTRCQHYTN